MKKVTVVSPLSCGMVSGQSSYEMPCANIRSASADAEIAAAHTPGTTRDEFESVRGKAMKKRSLEAEEVRHDEELVEWRRAQALEGPKMAPIKFVQALHEKRSDDADNDEGSFDGVA